MPWVGNSRQLLGSLDDIIDLLAKNSNGIRLFSFGIGASSGKTFVKSLARVTSGNAEFIGTKTSLGEATMKQLERALRPVFNKVRLQSNLHDQLKSDSNSERNEKAVDGILFSISPLYPAR